ncbi:MAG: cytochrome c biogenesis protein ResB [Cyanobacteriota bacterium]|jgi:cytochrome c biogenesis protein|nr:cytochrome c biogenesis protein ResB [Cyanobacteriota bacterium]
MTSLSPAANSWRRLLRLVAWIADLRLAIVLLLLIAVASGIGTAIPQKESLEFYQQRYDTAPWLGWLKGAGILRLQLDHVYSSSWFLALLALLGLALILCSWRRQWPALQASLRWIDYTTPRQLSKLALAETLTHPRADGLEVLGQRLRERGWSVRSQEGRLAARKGVLGRVGPLLVHAGMVVLMVGSAWGALAGQRLEQFLAPGRELELLDRQGQPQVTLALDAFAISRDPAGRPEQFTSRLRLIPPAAPTTTREAEISVNHPLRYRGMTLYQADWTLAAIQIQLGRSPVLELPLQRFPQLGEQVWGVLLPTRPDGSQPVLLTLTSEVGPVEVFAADGSSLALLQPGGAPQEVQGLPIRVAGVLPASGILLKRDPGVPLVYTGFAIALLGGGLSLVATRQLWVVEEQRDGGRRLHAAGLCNRNLTAFARELPTLLEGMETPEQTPQQG